MDRNLALNLARVTEAAALGAAKYMGRGDKNKRISCSRWHAEMFDTLNETGCGDWRRRNG